MKGARRCARLSWQRPVRCCLLGMERPYRHRRPAATTWSTAASTTRPGIVRIIDPAKSGDLGRCRTTGLPALRETAIRLEPATPARRGLCDNSGPPAAQPAALRRRRWRRPDGRIADPADAPGRGPAAARRPAALATRQLPVARRAGAGLRGRASTGGYRLRPLHRVERDLAAERRVSILGLSRSPRRDFVVSGTHCPLPAVVLHGLAGGCAPRNRRCASDPSSARSRWGTCQGSIASGVLQPAAYAGDDVVGDRWHPRPRSSSRYLVVAAPDRRRCGRR